MWRKKPDAVGFLVYHNLFPGMIVEKLHFMTNYVNLGYNQHYILCYFLTINRIFCRAVYIITIVKFGKKLSFTGQNRKKLDFSAIFGII